MIKQLHKKILIVEDDEDMREELFDIFVMEGFLVLKAKDGKEGLRLALKKRPDLILLDIAMPVMGGIEMIRELRKDEDAKDIPVIVVSSYAMKGDDEKAEAAGAKGYITKPIDTRTFAETIRTFL